MEWIFIIDRMMWFGIASTGFAILFNVPLRTLPTIFIIGAIAGCTKLLLLHAGISIILASLAGSLLIGIITIPFAHIKHAPPLVFSIPAVIPLVPGVLAYKMMTGLIQLAGDVDPATYNTILAVTVNNGLKVMFVLMSLAGGVAIPMLLTRQKSVKYVRLKKFKK
jgi:uncharacterized membrane protein YjjB (DUF3815 family)